MTCYTFLQVLGGVISYEFLPVLLSYDGRCRRVGPPTVQGGALVISLLGYNLSLSSIFASLFCIDYSAHTNANMEITLLLLLLGSLPTFAGASERSKGSFSFLSFREDVHHETDALLLVLLLRSLSG